MGDVLPAGSISSSSCVSTCTACTSIESLEEAACVSLCASCVSTLASAETGFAAAVLFARERGSDPGGADTGDVPPWGGTKGAVDSRGVDRGVGNREAAADREETAEMSSDAGAAAERVGVSRGTLRIAEYPPVSVCV